MKIKNKLLLLGIVCLPTLSFASHDEPATSDIASLFPIAAQSHSDKGEIDMQGWPTIKGTEDKKGALHFKKQAQLNLPGNCDDKKCSISGKLAPSFSLKKFDDGKNKEIKQWQLDKPKNIPSSSTSIVCDSNNNNKSTFKAVSYEKFIVKSECTISADTSDVIIEEVVSVTGDATLYLKPGNYWLETLELAGSGKIKAQPNTSGAINLYVDDQVNLKSSAPLGTISNPVNIFYGGELEIHGNEVTGMVRAKKISLKGGDAKLNLTAGEYWFENVNMSGSAQLTLHDPTLTTLHIKVQIEAQGGDTIINKDGKPLLIYIYDGNDASLDLQGSAKLYGHVYTKGGVKLQEGHIDGAVNVHSLFIKGGSINYRPLTGVPGAKLDHYRLHFNTNTDNVTAYACGDGTCSPSTLYTGEVKKLHIHADNPNFHNFIPFYGSSSITKKWNTSQCTTFTIQNADKNKNGANPWPESELFLQCFVDGTRVDNCEVCPKAEPVSSYGYVYGSATIPSVSLSSTNEFTVKEGGGNSLAIYDSKLAINNGSKIKLPLEVTFDKADKVDLVLTDTDGREYSVSVTFVPKSLGWVAQSAENGCGENGSKFDYMANSKSCKAIGVAGSSVNLVLEARGEGGKKIDNYEVDLGNNALQVNELNAIYQSKVESKFAMRFSSNSAEKTTLSYNIDQVALIKAQVKSHYAPDIKDTKAAGVKVTNGDTLVIGRTVPASLSVKPIAGDIKDNVVYAAQPQPIEFVTTPVFILKGLDINGNELPSYSGEFAGGLIGSSEIKLDAKLSDSALTLRYSEPNKDEPNNDGAHKLELDAASLKFIKDQPFSETSLALPLELTINAHDQTQGVTGEANLGSDNDKLRYGFLVLKDTELAVDQSGEIQSELHYYSDNTETTAVDKGKGYNLNSLSLTLGIKSAATTSENPTVELAAKKLDVSAFSKIWRGDVTIEGDSSDFVWLKPYSKVTSQLVNPKGQLTISDRKRGNDKVFNRREVVR